MAQFKAYMKRKGTAKQVTEKYKVREFVVCDEAASYPKTVQFQLTQDRCTMIDNINIGDEVQIDYSLSGREWKNQTGEIKVFNTLEVFRIEVLNKAVNTPTIKPFNPILDNDLPF